MKRKHAKTFSEVSDEILALAQGLNAIFEQSYSLVKPLVDEACKHPDNVGQDELDHLFDATLDIMTAKGERLFRRLCKTFAPYYPDSVNDYIRIKQEFE